MIEKIGKDNPSIEDPNQPKTVGGRLRYWRKLSSLRLVDLAATINVSQGSLSDLENDKSLPSATTLTGLCRKTDVNICWLLTGEGDMIKEKDAVDKDVSAFKEVVRLMSDTDFKRTVHRLVKIFERGTPTQKAQIKGFMAGVETD
ncbi:helix-turn-helix domain-containing protein [Nitrospina gracilis]|uniref:helix-turn-helix domain-containing protein n=1 Tax=Nitrospina gracilis TaxID=35801 RepID=UPI001F219B2F|nr:helix-turn-helix domain-containing protein [Nitrospina gracilis]MCF8720477.1 transcriptional regulator with XRE-family HTH domain [Nitrospina gracilis Nb-211]